MKFTIKEIQEAILLELMPRESYISKDARRAHFFGEKACKIAEDTGGKVDDLSEHIDRMQRMMKGYVKLSIMTTILLLLGMLLILLIR